MSSDIQLVELICVVPPDRSLSVTAGSAVKDIKAPGLTAAEVEVPSSDASPMVPSTLITVEYAYLALPELPQTLQVLYHVTHVC